MLRKYSWIGLLLSFIMPVTGLGQQHIPNVADTVINGERFISFSGYQWAVAKVSKNKKYGGPFYYSDSKDNVWVDKKGRLHLKITQRDGKWYVAKVTLLNSYSHGKYIFQVDSRIDNFDKNVVAGLFAYRNDTEEIDIEFSKWSKDGNMDSQFAIQPSSKPENKKRYFLNYSGKKSTHWFNWQPDRIDFASYRGHSLNIPAPRKVMQTWTYTGADIPPDLDELAKINLWLFRGRPPSDGKEQEIIFSSFSIQ